MKSRLITVAFAMALAALAAPQNRTTIHTRHEMTVATTANMERIPPRMGLNLQDRRFMDEVAMTNEAEIKIGRLAQRNGADWGRTYGKNMVHEHTMFQASLRQLARKKGVTLARGLNKAARTLYQRLATLHGEDFDRAFQAAMIHGHEGAVNAFAQEIKHGRDSDVRGYAVILEPEIKLHHKLAMNKATLRHRGG